MWDWIVEHHRLLRNLLAQTINLIIGISLFTALVCLLSDAVFGEKQKQVRPATNPNLRRERFDAKTERLIWEWYEDTLEEWVDESREWPIPEPETDSDDSSQERRLQRFEENTPGYFWAWRNDELVEWDWGKWLSPRPRTWRVDHENEKKHRPLYSFGFY